MAVDARPLPVERLRALRLPRPPVADVALGGLLAALSVLATLSAPDTSPGHRWAAVVVGVLQTLPLLWRRTHPGIGLAVYSVTKPVQYAAVLPVSEWPWLVLVYSLFAHRRPRVAAAVLALTLLAVYPSSAAAMAAAQDVSFLGVLGGLTLIVTAQLVVVAALGWAVRAARTRELRQRELADRIRLTAAIGRERARIATELNSIVAARLQRVVARTEQLREQLERSPRCAHQVLSDVHDEARQALAAMRRTLGFLRSERSAPDPAPAEPTVHRWALPAPTLSGIGLVCAFGAAALLLDTVLPARPPANEQFAEIWPWLFLQHDRPWSLLLLFVQFAVLGWWRSAPLSALAVGTIAASAAFLLEADHFVAGFSWMLLVYAAGAGAAPVASALTMSVATLTYLVVFLLGEAQAPRYLFSTGELVFSYTLVPILWAVGALHRRATRRTRQRTDDRATDDMRAALSQERNRIARELHDVLAHNVSAIVVQAGAARSVAGTQPKVVREAIGHIEESGRRTLDALPTLLELRPEAAAVAAPVRLDAEGVEQLVAPLRSAGLPVTVELCGHTAGNGGDEVELFAQRILMEALTNVLRHAGPTPTHVRLDQQADAVTVEVADAGPVAGHRAASDGGGHGLIGMRERAELLGGALAAGHHGEHGWLVQARLPRSPAS